MKIEDSPARIKPEDFRAWNERMVVKYDPDAFHRHPNPFIRYIERKRVRIILKLLKSSVDGRVIEIGCGAGNVIEKVLYGKRFGVDISSLMLSKTKEKFKESIHLIQANAQNLSIKNEAFTHLICSEVLEHLITPSLSLKEMERILTRPGVAIISIPNELRINRLKAFLKRLGIFNWFFKPTGGYAEIPERMEDEWHLHAYSLEAWLDLLTDYFKVIRIKRVPFFWLPLRYVILLKKQD